MYKTVLLKLSGEAIGSANGPFDFTMLDSLAKQIKKIAEKGTKVGIVVGGGNICRGRTFEKLGMDRKHSDYIGMKATIMNAEVLGEALTNNGVKNKVFTCLPVKNVMDYDAKKANSYLKKGYVCIFGGGTGKPFFSTDTACAMRASDINAEVIFFAKNGVDGVYDKDPGKNADAKRYDAMSFNDIIKNKLEVIDLAAAKICYKNKIEGFVFNMSTKNSLVKAVDKKITGTIIK